jgi:sterol 3beta-glucosyltransferase
MRVLLATIGTRGDVQPYLALALGLRAAGHEVAICTAPRFGPMLAEHGFECLPMNGGLLDLLDSAKGRALFADLDSLLGMLRTAVRTLRQVGPIHHRMVADCWAAACAFAPDVLVHHPKLIWMPAFAARLGIPAVLGLLAPMLVPTRESPLPGLPRWPLGGAYNRATWGLVRVAMTLGGRPFVGRWQREHDPQGLSHASTPLRLDRDRPVPVLHAYSAAVCPAPPDWPAHARVTGWWFVPDEPWIPPPTLAAFLADGPAPVYVGFGSMAGTDPARSTQTVLAALRRAGVRAVLATGWGGLRAADVPATVHVLDAAPHGWLFERVAAVVHHGGAGTTGAGLRAGRPTLICPFGLDQPFWGRCVADAGAGPLPIAHKHLDPSSLADAIVRLTTDPAIAAAAQRIGRTIRAEDGVGAAVAAIEAQVGPRA